MTKPQQLPRVLDDSGVPRLEFNRLILRERAEQLADEQRVPGRGHAS